MNIGQLVKLKPQAELHFTDSVHGSIPYINKCETCYCIFISYCDQTRSCEVFLDGAVGFNIDPHDLEAV